MTEELRGRLILTPIHLAYCVCCGALMDARVKTRLFVGTDTEPLCSDCIEKFKIQLSLIYRRRCGWRHDHNGERP